MPRVLVVDDEPGVQESLRMLLKRDFDVSTAGDVTAALRIIDAESPHLILLDLLMPGRNGMELLPTDHSYDYSSPNQRFVANANPSRQQGKASLPSC